MSATFTFSGKSSILTSDFYPELELDSRFSYSCALLEFTAYNSIPNVTHKNHKFYFTLDTVKNKESVDLIELLIKKPADPNSVHSLEYKLLNEHCYSIKIPTGAYELEKLFSYLTEKTKEIGISLQLSFDASTLTCKVKSSVQLQFNWSDSIHELLGFSNTFIEPGTKRVSDKIIKITKLNTISVECDIVSGSYTNGIRGHSLYEFAPAVDIGFKIIEVPKHIIYLPVNRRVISSIQIRIVDQDGCAIDFRGEQITCRIHIKRE